MLGVGLRKLCPQDSFGYAFREKEAVRKSTPGGCKTGPRGVQNGLWKASRRLFYASGPYLAAKAARKPSLGGSGGALGTLLALLEPSWGLLGRSWGVPGRSWAPLEGCVGAPERLPESIFEASFLGAPLGTNKV